jgi:chemotaxis signal transduction protein
MPAPAPANPRALPSEQIILFRIGEQLFAVSSASVQEVRSADTLASAATEISVSSVPQVRYFMKRGEQVLFLVDGAAHFGLPASQGILAFVLRNTRAVLLVHSIEKMSTMTRLQALPLTFCHEERQWYRGLTALDQNVVPVVYPEGFLSAENLALLDAAFPPKGETSGKQNALGTEFIP